MIKKKKIEVLESDTSFVVSLNHRHPRGAMKLGGVSIVAGPAQHVVIPKGTNIASEEVQHWFTLETPKAGSKPVNSLEIQEKLKQEKEESKPQVKGSKK